VLPEVTGMRVVEFSGEDPGPCPLDPDAHYSFRHRELAERVKPGAARHLVDGYLATAWRPGQGRTSGWVVFELPGEEPVPLGAFTIDVTHNRYQRQDMCHPREMKLYVRRSSDAQWQDAGSYTRYSRGAGRIFPILSSPEARQVKLEVLSNHGHPETVEIGEFKLYRAAAPIE
jgi:hypothetical protein